MVNDRHNNVRNKLRGMETTNWRAGFGAAAHSQVHIHIYVYISALD